MLTASFGIVQKIDGARLGPFDAAVVRTRAPGATHHLLVVSGRRGLRAALVSGEARAAVRDAKHPALAAWRARLEGARVVAIGREGVTFERAGETVCLACASGRLALRDGGDTGEPIEEDATLGDEIAPAAIAARRDALVKAIARALARIDRRVDAVKRDLARIAEAEEVAARAQLFVAEAARVPRGAKSMSVVDWSTGEAKTIEMPLDPAKGAREQIDAIFKRARRLKEGARVGRARLADAETTASALRTIAAEAPSADLAAIDALAARAQKIAPRDFRAATANEPRAAKQEPLPPYKTFRGASDAKILVGRGAAHNDELTLHVAKPHDLWLHVKGQSGAHVVVPLAKGASCPPDVLVDAAHLAAHFSGARDEAVVEVAYVPKRYVRKPRGSPPGLVTLEREKVIVLRKEEARMRALLESEER